MAGFLYAIRRSTAVGQNAFSVLCSPYAPLLLLASVACSPYAPLLPRASALLSLYSTSSRVNAALYLRHTVGKVLFYFRFPEAQHNPAVVAQFDGIFEVTLHIAPDFFVPIFYVGRNVVALQTLSVPEFPVTEYCDFVLGNNDIRMAAAHLIVLAVADALVPQGLAQKDFYFCILAADGLHVFMALFLGQLVHDIISIYSFIISVIINVISRKLNIRYPNLIAIPSFIFITSNFIHC